MKVNVLDNIFCTCFEQFPCKFLYFFLNLKMNYQKKTLIHLALSNIYDWVNVI